MATYLGNFMATGRTRRSALGMTELDEVLLDVIRPRVEEGLKFLVVLTKADKLTRAEATKALSIAKLQAGGGEVRLFSAPKRIGVEDVATLLWDWAHPKGATLAAAPDALRSQENAGV